MRGHSNQRGFTLIEVLVALLVFSIGLLGLAALQTSSLKYNQTAYFRSQATILAHSMMDQLRAERATVTSASAAPSTLVSAWNSQIEATLPATAGGDANGTVIISGPDSEQAEIRINWGERDGGTVVTRTFTFESRL